MNPGGRQPRIPDITLEQYLLGELPENEMLATQRFVEEDEETRARLAALKRSDQEILERYPPHLMSRLILSRLERHHRQESRSFLFLARPMTAFVGAAAALALLFMVLPYDSMSWAPGKDASRQRVMGQGPQLKLNPKTPGGSEALERGTRLSAPGKDASTERAKGQGPQLKLYRKTPDGTEALEDGTRAFRGDLVRIGYQAAGRAYGAIVSVDGLGTVTLHLPHQGSQSVRLENHGQVLLDFALELDDAPGWERFYFVTCDAPFDVTPVLRAARQIEITSSVHQANKLVLPKDFGQFVISLEKGTRP